MHFRLISYWRGERLIWATACVALSFILPITGFFLFFTLSASDPIWAHLLYFGWLLLPECILLATGLIYVKYYRQNRELIKTNKKELTFYFGMIVLTVMIVIVNISKEVYGLQTLRYWAQRLGY